MSIASISPNSTSPHARRSAADSAIQGVFAQILASAGEAGYASADTSTTTNASGDVATAWQDWLAATGNARYQSLDDAQQTFSGYEALLVDAQQQNAYTAPQAYLQQLSKEELATLQRINNLADPVDVSTLTPEGALNLLLPPPTQVDRNGDGLTQTGIGYSIRFPDSRTPRTVVDAWNEATAEMPEGERMTRELQMKSDILLANIQVDSAGQYVRTIEPGDADFINPQADANYSYLQKARQALASVEYFKHQTPPEQYARDKSFWTAWQTALEKHGAA